MELPPERKIIVVEGITNAGKTTAANILRKQMPGCTQVKFSDYYHKSVQRELGTTDLSRLDSDVVGCVAAANYKRYVNLLGMVKESCLDDYVIERLHPTDYVYQKHLFGCLRSDFSEIEQLINELEASMIILTLDDASLLQRMEETLAHRNRRKGAGFEIPAHILSYNSNRKKRDLYLEFYEHSNVKKKVLVDTSRLGESKLVRVLSEL